jgi:hypothetical protein
MTVQEKIKKIKDTERILKAITLCEEDLFETIELENEPIYSNRFRLESGHIIIYQ